MAEYIERAEVLKKFEEIKNSVDITFADALYLDGVMELIDSVPSADVVEAVRCKDCKWHDSVDGPTAKIEQLQSELEQVKRERDAAITEITRGCDNCRYWHPGTNTLCTAPSGLRCNVHRREAWQWRGAKEGKHDV